MIDIAGLDKADVLAALYHAALPFPVGVLHYRPRVLTRELATLLLESQQFFIQLYDRFLYTDVGGTTFDATLYDRVNGEGAAARALAPLRHAQEVTHAD